MSRRCLYAALALLLLAPAQAGGTETVSALDQARDRLVQRLGGGFEPQRVRSAIAALERRLRAVRVLVARHPPGQTTAARRELRRLGRGTATARRAMRLQRRDERRPARRAARAARRQLRFPLTALRALPARPAPPPAPPTTPGGAFAPGPNAPEGAPAPRPLPAFHVAGYKPLAVPADREPLQGPTPFNLASPTHPVNPDGTLRYLWHGVEHPHPLLLENYALAERLSPPWYSGMAQGRALLLLHRLHEVIGDDRWRAAADRVYATTFHPRAAGHPWMAWVDGDGYLWFEEYPSDAEPPRVLNGHISATIGYWKRARATGEPEARRLFDGGATTALHYAHVLRRPGQPSAYSVRTPVQLASYQVIHVRLLRQLALLTGDAAFDAIADQYEADGDG